MSGGSLLTQWCKVSAIEEAAKRAAVQAPADVNTILFEYSDLQPKQEDCFAIPPLPSSSASTSFAAANKNGAQDKPGISSPNPLKSLLGYSMDDSPTRSQESESSDEMDKEWATFMEELKSNGLLQEEKTGQGLEKAVEGTSEACDGDKSRAGVDKGGGGPHESNDNTDQQVMGEVDGAPGWHTVLDSGTGTTYFWNSTTDEVSWDPPEGAVASESETPASKSEDSELTNVVEEETETVGGAGGAEVKGLENGLVSYRDDQEEKEESNMEEGEIEMQDVQELKLENPQSPLEEKNETLPGISGDANNDGDVEEGQVQEVASSPGVKEKQDLWDKVTSTVKAVKDGIGAWYDVIPEAVKLAIVAETHLDQWMFMTGQLHLSSAAEGDHLKHFWSQYERYVDEAMEWVSESLPGALSHMAYAPNNTDEAAISSQPPVPSGGEYHWDASNAAYDWSAYASLMNDSQHLPPLPTEPLPPFPPNSEEVPPPPPGTDDAQETTEEDVDVNMDISDGEGPEHVQEKEPPSPTYGATVDGFATGSSLEKPHAYPPEPDADTTRTANVNGGTEANDPLIVHVASPEQEVSKDIDKSNSNTSDKKRKLEKVVGSGMGLLGKKKKVSKASKNLSKLMNKWQAVKQEEEERAIEEDPFNVEAMEKKKIVEMEEWRLNQLKSGEAENNANFQPLKGDWRSMVRRKEKKKAVDEAKENGASSSLDDMSSGLPEGWKALVDDTSGEIYYGNVETMETRWERPES